MARVNRWACSWCGNTYLSDRDLALHEAACGFRPPAVPVGPWPEPSPIISRNAQQRERERLEARAAKLREERAKDPRYAQAQAAADNAAASEDGKFQAAEAMEALAKAARESGTTVAAMKAALGALNTATDNAFLHGTAAPKPRNWWDGIRGLCQDCGRGFETQEAMDAHRRNDHPPAPPPAPEPPKRKRAVRLTDED